MSTTDNTSTETPPLTGLIIPPEIVRETIQAQHKFSIDETLKLKDDLLASIRNETQIEAEFASVKAEFKSRTEKAELEKDSILRRLTDGFEMRPTRAIVQFNTPEHGRKTYVREDSGEIIRDEAMTYADQERPLFKDGDGKDALAPSSPAEPEHRAGEIVDAEFSNTEGDGTKEDLGRIIDIPNAGQTPVGAALDGAAVNVEQPQIVIPDFESAVWTTDTLRKAFVKAARKAKWFEASMSTMSAGLRTIETVEAMQTMLRPHVVAGTLSFEQMFAQAVADDKDGSKLREHFARILAAFPEAYPGGNSEHNFAKFNADVADEVINKSRTQEGAAE